MDPPKIDVSVHGVRTPICTGAKCSGDSIDCSGAAANGLLSACLVSGICNAAYPALRLGVMTNASGIADFFYSHRAFNTSEPAPGDLVFFADSGVPRERRGITHVAVFLGDTRDGHKVIFHARGRPKSVALFESLPENDVLFSRVVGSGNISALVRSIQP